MSGNDREVREYVMSNDKAEEFLDKLVDMIRFLIPNYIAEGKTQLVIAVGCTEGSIVLSHWQMSCMRLFRKTKETTELR